MIFILLISALLLQNCISPNDPDGLQIQAEYTIFTNGYCRHIAVCDSLIYTTVDEHGLQLFSHNLEQGGEVQTAPWLKDLEHGQETGEEILFAEHYPIVFAMKYFEGIYFNNIAGFDGFEWVRNLDSDTRDFPRHFTIIEDTSLNVITVFTLNRSFETGEQNTIILTDYTNLTARKLTVMAFDDFYFIEQPQSVSELVDLDINAKAIAYADGIVAVSNAQEGIILIQYLDDGTLVQSDNSLETPGEVISLAAMDSIVFAGLNHSMGCYTALLDSEGNPVDTFRFAQGFTVNSVTVNNGIAALACGNDGVLLYSYEPGAQSLDFVEIGWIESAYAYEAVLYDEETILVATREGIQIYRYSY